MGSIRWLTKPNGFIKVIALLINILIITLMSIYGLPAYGMSVSQLLVIILTVGGLILVLFVLLIGYGIDENYLEAPAQVIVTGLMGAILSVVSGTLIIVKTKHPPELITYDRAPVLYSYGTLTLVNALLFAADAFFAFKNRSRVSS